MAAALLPARAAFAAAESDRDSGVRVDVVDDVTEAGKKIPHPTRDKPAYYAPMPEGYTNEGDVMTVFQRPPPPDAQIERLIVKALADQGYLPATKQSPPSLVLMFWWGYMAPIFQVTRHGNNGTLINAEEMTELVSGDAPLDPNRPEIEEAARIPQWYMRVTAIDFADLKYRHKITGLWREHISTNLWGHYLDEVLPTMIATGAPMFGRDTRAQFAQAPVVPMGRVVVGTPTVRDYPIAPAATDKK